LKISINLKEKKTLKSVPMQLGKCLSLRRTYLRYGLRLRGRQNMSTFPGQYRDLGFEGFDLLSLKLHKRVQSLPLFHVLLGRATQLLPLCSLVNKLKTFSAFKKLFYS
jgi:hypothetical protein